MLQKLKKIVVEKYNSNVINSADSVAPLKGELSKDGYLMIDNYFDANDVAKFEEVSNSLNESDSKDVLKKFPFLAKPLFDDRIVSIVKDYLGKDAVLDYASARRFLASGAKSDTWHHDSVGHRIKIFLCLTDQDLSTHTLVVPGTHLAKHKSFTDNQIGGDIANYDDRFKNVIGKKNSLIIFDTNLLHKGVYSDVPRDLVQFEFSNKKKSALKGHIGMRSSSFDKSVLKSELIGLDKLKHADHYVYYQ